MDSTEETMQGTRREMHRSLGPTKRWALVVTVLVAATLCAVTVLLAGRQGQNDAGSGESLPGIYMRYHGHVYMNIPGEGYYLMPEADAGSFGLLGKWDSQNIGKDRSAVYCGSQVIAQLHPEQVRFVANSYVSDGSRAWYCTSEKDNPDYRWWQFFTRSGDEDSPEKPRRQDFELIQLKAANVAALKIVVGAYAQDGTHAFYEGGLIPDADGASLQTVSLGWGELAGRTDESYARDSRHVYFQGTMLPGARPAAFSALKPDSDQGNNLYGQDRATGQFYFGAQPFPAKVDGVDSSSLQLLIADRDRAHHEFFYNASGIWYWDYRGGALERGCDNPFDAVPAMLSPGAWADGRNTFVTRAIEDWGNSRSDHSLHARKTQLLKLSGLATAQWSKVGELVGGQGQERGTVWKSGSQLFFAPSSGMNNFLNDALYVVHDLEGLKRDLLSAEYYRKILKAEDIRRLDSSDSTIVCRATSRY
jgi:hypothetical protein